MTPRVHISGRGALDQLDRLARLLDSRWHIPGTGIAVGVDALVGLIPGLGSVATGLVSLYIIEQSRKLGAPGSLIARMIGNVVLDTLAGSIPVIGSVFDVLYRANNRNVELLRRHLETQAARSGR